ncbi:ENHANCER OF AG-4 protein 2 isoform X2 [Sesamum indicum]|uniref:ENHANCER OF AG-4 protein 2 isoform X2 n=1 Tax=Sesamum indicum TaxID=4182 RepID=A0A8M8UUM1_SESIN|nr:ENHANCER OF AG-4 protein 2 isoform X2 [Sesamum indicum]
MAPGRKRGAKGVKTKSDLSLGDLVLAKVKGFPAWPAKISRPEDWERAPDPKKYFVQFFGTSEIAFVAPADIQAFTSEAKNKLSARCQGKTVKYFAQAVKEISEEFELLQRKNLSGIRDDDNAQDLASQTQSVDPVVDEALEIKGNDRIDTEGPNCNSEIKGLSDLGSVLEPCSQRQCEMECQDVKPSLSDDMNHSLSPHLSLGKRNKLSRSPKLVKKLVLGCSPSDSLVKEEGSCDVKVEGMAFDVDQTELTDSHEPKLAMGPKRKHEGFMHRHSGAIPHEHIGDEVQTKLASGGSMKVSSSLGLGVGSQRRGKRLLKDKKHSEAADDGPMDSEAFEEHKKVISRKKMKYRYEDEKQTNESNRSTDEDDLPPTKRHRALGMMCTSASVPENKSGNSTTRKNGMVRPNKARSPVPQRPVKRRAVRLCDDEDDELPKTPVHGGYIHKVSVIPSGSDSKKNDLMRGENNANDQLASRTVDNALKEHAQSSQVSNKASSATAQQSMDKGTRESSAEHVSLGPMQLESDKSSFVEAKPVGSPKRSSQSITATGTSGEPEKKHFSKAPGGISQKKVPPGANRAIATASDRSTTSLYQPISEKSKATSSGEKRNTTPRSDSQNSDSVFMVGNPDESITSLGERPESGKDIKTSFPVDLKNSGSVMSMKDLIAAAQAKKRQAHLQNSYGNPLALLVNDADMLGRSPSPIPDAVAVESGNTLQLDVQGLQPTSPSSDVRQFSSMNEHENEELEEKRVSSGHQATGSSLSGGTEAAVARDAFEGMIETLSRTKESIGRATRLAIDCAKYGIANEVVELLIRKLENEQSFRHKVDLFFLVDSITQCSHSQKGIAGASYIPTVQAALPRLIGAAAPSGPGAQENRRQCHKVLRLWLERKILPESVLRRHMDDIGATDDDKSAGFSLRRPSRAERAIDDPIREMEGMLVDEYGSNATFQLPGFLASHVFDEEEEEEEDKFPTNLCKEVADTSPSEHTPGSRDPENYTVTPSDRRHHVLEDVDGELEMEDVSGNQKDERSLFDNGITEVSILEQSSDGVFESASNTSELLPSPEGSPPLPPDSPPVSPPLPTSPPPTSPSPPPPPPHPPLTSPPPLPPPPPASSHQVLFPPPPVGPPPFLSQQSLPPQHHPALMSQHMPPLPSTMSSSQPLAYHPPPLPREIGGTPTGNQHANMVSNTHGSHSDAPVLPQQSFFHPAGVSNAHEHVGYNSSRSVEYGKGDGYMTPQALQHRQPFLPGKPFVQRPLHPEPPPQQTTGQFSYPNSVQQHQYPPYSLPNMSDGPRRYAADVQWRMPANELNADCQLGGWMTGGRSCSGPPYSHEGYFGPPPERPPAGIISFPPSSTNSQPAATPIPVHGVPMMPCRPDMSAVNWRPA